MGEKVRDFINSHKSNMSLAVSSDNRIFEDSLIKSFQHLRIPNIPQSYRRYGYGLLSYFSKKLVFDWFEDYHMDKVFPLVQSKITNSGMSAIDLTLTTLSLYKGVTEIVAPQEIYFASDELLDSYGNSLFNNLIRFQSQEDLEEAINNVEADSVLYLETCLNGPNMSFFDEESIKKYAEKFKYVLVDGSLIGLSRINPSIFETGNVVYIESLSKNYHDEESSRITAGLIVYPNGLEDIFQKRFYSAGNYLQLNDLMELPINIYQVGKNRIELIAKNAQKFYREARKNIHNESIELPNVSEDLKKIPLVLFLDFKENSRLEEYIRLSQISKRGSFGHNETYILPIGLMWESAPPGLARIAFGSEEYSPQIIKALSEVNK